MAKSKVKKNIPPKWECAFEEFLWWKQANGLSQTTLNDYKDYVSRFYKQYPDVYVDEQKLKNSLFEYMGKPCKPAYYSLKLIYLRAFFTWCVENSIYTDNPLKKVTKRKAEGRIVNLD